MSYGGKWYPINSGYYGRKPYYKKSYSNDWKRGKYGSFSRPVKQRVGNPTYGKKARWQKKSGAAEAAVRASVKRLMSLNLTPGLRAWKKFNFSRGNSVHLLKKY